MELKSKQPGYWEFVHGPEGSGSYIYFNCPCGCKYMDAVCVLKSGEAAPAHTHWQWDGNEKQPTLSPSLKRHSPCQFHGHLQTGAWSTCGDGAALAPDIYRGTP